MVLTINFEILSHLSFSSCPQNGKVGGVDVAELAKEVKELQATVAAQDKRIEELEAKVKALEAGGGSTDEETA